jgi:hypothetical protein
MDDEPETLGRYDRFSVELARFLDDREDPSENVHPRGNRPLDVLAALEAQEQLDSIVG